MYVHVYMYNRMVIAHLTSLSIPRDNHVTSIFPPQVWNHPWVLKLDEDRQLERAEREAMYGLSDTEDECEDDDETLGGFIVNDSDETSSTGSSSKARGKVSNTTHTTCSHVHVHTCACTCSSTCP